MFTTEAAIDRARKSPCKVIPPCFLENRCLDSLCGPRPPSLQFSERPTEPGGPTNQPNLYVVSCVPELA